MKRIKWITGLCLTLLTVGSLTLASGAGEKKKKILLYSQSDGYRHDVVTRLLTGRLSYVENVFKLITAPYDYELCFSQDYHDLESESQLKQFDAIIFFTSGHPKINREAFLKWLRAGGAFIGIRSAADTFTASAPEGWPEYIKILGGAVAGTTAEPCKVTIKVEDGNHPITKMFDREWETRDKIYHFERFEREQVHVLLSVDKEITDLQQEGLSADRDYPVSWTRTEGQGRIFYTSLGQQDMVWRTPLFREHLAAGIKWALGEK